MFQITAGAEEQRSGLPRRSFLQLGALTLAGLTGTDLTVSQVARAAGRLGAGDRYRCLTERRRWR